MVFGNYDNIDTIKAGHILDLFPFICTPSIDVECKNLKPLRVHRYTRSDITSPLRGRCTPIYFSGSGFISVLTSLRTREASGGTGTRW